MTRPVRRFVPVLALLALAAPSVFAADALAMRDVRDLAAPPASARPDAFLVARVRSGDAVELRSGPGAARVVARVGSTTEFGSARALGVVARTGRWVGVSTPALPNGQLGWLDLDRAKVRLARTRVSLTLDLSERELVLRRDGKAVRRMRVGVGRPGSPTPVGRFAVTDKLPGARYGAYYGCCILALSATQPRLPAGWKGGDRIAIHGTNDSGSIGAAVSAGCPHASDADMRALMRAVPLGAPVFVRA